MVKAKSIKNIKPYNQTETEVWSSLNPSKTKKTLNQSANKKNSL